MDLRIKKEDGFSMVEVMMALGIFAVSLIGIMGISTLSVYYNSMSRQVSIASMVGTELVNRLQYLSSDPYTNFTSGFFNDTNPGNNASLGVIDIVNDPPTSPAPEHAGEDIGFGGIEIGGILYRGYWNVADIDQNSDGIVDAKEIVVIVRWKGAKETRYNYTSLSSSLFRPPPNT